MTINEQVLDSIKVYVPFCEDESYMAWLKKELRLKHQHHLLKFAIEPFFLLDVPFEE